MPNKVREVFLTVDGFDIVEFDNGATGIVKDGKEVDIMKAPKNVWKALSDIRRGNG